MRVMSKAAPIALGCALLFSTSMPAAALDILLSNDDGYNTPGIQALQTAFKAAGHNVTIVAPSGNRSGSSTSLTFTPFAVQKVASDVYSVDTSPAMTVKFGVAEILTGKKSPDLIISGINNGANIGPSTVISGTVGNVIAGISQLDAPIPGIAISTDLLDSDPASAANRKHFKDVANFTVRVVRRLTRNDKLVGLEPGEGININYPALAPGQTKGAVLAQQGFAPTFSNAFSEVSPGVWVIASAFLTPKTDVPHADTILFNKGYVTMVPIDGDYTAKAPVVANLKHYLGGIRP